MVVHVERRAARSWTRACDELRSGRPVVLVDGAGGPDGGELVIAAAAADGPTLSFAVRVTSGLLTVALPDAACDRLRLPEMNPLRERTDGLRYTVSVDAARDVSTGISARDRAVTMRLLADPGTRPDALARPGHVLVLRACDGGVLERPGRVEAAVDLVRASGHTPAAATARILSPTGETATRAELSAFAERHGLTVLRVEDVVRARRAEQRAAVRAHPVPA